MVIAQSERYVCVLEKVADIEKKRCYICAVEKMKCMVNERESIGVRSVKGRMYWNVLEQ